MAKGVDSYGGSCRPGEFYLSRYSGLCVVIDEANLAISGSTGLQFKDSGAEIKSGLGSR